ncbi:MAG: ABC transporter permease subunit [Actinomycetota bacterium]
MIRLVRMEMLRLFSRRLFKIAAVGVLLLITVIVVVDGVHHSKRDAAAYEKFKNERLASYDAFVAANPQPDMHPTREEVAKDPQSYCFAQQQAPASGTEQPAQPGNPCGGAPKAPYETSVALFDFGKAVAVICAFAGFLIGASAAGAEWSAGTMQSLLFWEPRRVRVVLAKVVGLSAVIVLLFLAATALFTAESYAAGQLRGTTAGLTSGLWNSYLLLMLRGVSFAGFAAVLGFSVAFGSRVTAAAVGIAFVYFAVLENLLVAWKIWLARYMIGPLLAAWLNNGIADNGDSGRALRLTGVRAGVTLSVYAVVMLAGATVWFRQRDVT